MKKKSFNNRIHFLTALLLLAVALLFASCGKKEKKEVKEAKQPKEYLAVIDQTSKKIVKVEYNIFSTTTKEAVDELFDALSNYKSEVFTSPFSENLMADGWLFEDGTVSVYFTNDYYDLLITDEVLIRAAIVETICQLDGVSDISFFVDDTPLTIQGNVIGRMDKNSFLYDIAGADQTTSITLYFPDMEGKGLVKINRKVKLDARYTDEQLILEELLQGPKSGDSGVVKRGIPKKTKLLNVVTKDTICYVNLSSEFLEYLEEVPDELTVYSIVNSLCEVAGVRSVEFSVDGVKLEYYRAMACSELLTFNYDLLVSEEE